MQLTVLKEKPHEKEENQEKSRSLLLTDRLFS